MIISDVAKLFRQRTIVYLLGVFMALVLFNTTYMNLGTTVPLVVIIVTLLYAVAKSAFKQTPSNYFLLFIFVVFISTVLSGGDSYREVTKILLTILFVIAISSMKFGPNEVRFVSLIIFVSYIVYAILVIQAIGSSSLAFYGRVNIKILNSDYPLDPNVTASVFSLPIIIGLYNLLYGRLKILSLAGISVLLVAILACGSRGAFLGLVGVLFMLLLYMGSKKINTFYRYFLIALIIGVAVYSMFYAISDDSVMGMERIMDTDDADVSNGRLEIWAKRLQILLDSPLIGYGANYNIGPIHVACHNTFLQILYYGGLIGFYLFFKPVIKLYKRTSVSRVVKYALFLSVFVPIFFIDTLQERTIWNFFIFYELLSRKTIGEDCLIWIKNK